MLVQPIMSENYRVTGIKVGYEKADLNGIFQVGKTQHQIDFLIYMVCASAVHEKKWNWSNFKRLKLEFFDQGRV